MPKTEFLQIRLTPEDRNRLRRAAARDFIEPSTWGRRAILQALEQWEEAEARRRGRGAAEPAPRDTPPLLRVAEGKPSGSAKSKSTSKPKSNAKPKPGATSKPNRKPKPPKRSK